MIAVLVIPGSVNICLHMSVSTTLTLSRPKKRQRHLTPQTVRIDIHRLDSLMNLVGELVITKTRLEQLLMTYGSPDIEETLKSLSRVAGGLQDTVMKARMVPLAQVFNRFRMVRDLSRELGRQIEFIIDGEETELDRSVIDELVTH